MPGPAVTSMQAAVLAAAGEIQVVRVALPQPAPGEVRVRLQGCGVCASNLEPWAGPEWMQYPREPGELGHEGWGIIDALGAGVAGLTTGQRVAVLSNKGFAEYEVAAADSVEPLPDALDGQAFPGEPLACAINIFRRSDVQPGQTVAIVGIGFLGALLTKLASDAGARVIAISRRQFSLDLARRHGAAATIVMNDHAAIIEEVKALTDGRFCDRVIEAVGKQWPLDLAGELVREGGKLIIAGYHQDGPRQINMQMWNWKGIDVVNAHERDGAVVRAGLRQAIAMVAAGTIDPALLYTHRYSLQELGAALDATRDKPEGFVKALVLM